MKWYIIKKNPQTIAGQTTNIASNSYPWIKTGLVTLDRGGE